MFAKYFADIYTPQSNDRYDDENFQTISSEYVNMKSLNECDEWLEYEIAESEVNKAIVSLKLRKERGFILFNRNILITVEKSRFIS